MADLWQQRPVIGGAITTHYTYYVTGYGDFPVGLLANQRAWPASRLEAVKIGRNDKGRSIKLSSYDQPLPALWKGEGWRIGPDDLLT